MLETSSKGRATYQKGALSAADVTHLPKLAPMFKQKVRAFAAAFRFSAIESRPTFCQKKGEVSCSLSAA